VKGEKFERYGVTKAYMDKEMYNWHLRGDEIEYGPGLEQPMITRSLDIFNERKRQRI